MSAVARPASMPPNMTSDGAFPQHPSDVLIDLVADLLAPMFLGAAGGDYRYARLAAMETVWSYKASTQADLLQVIQIVAYGLAAVRTLCLSMTEEVSLPTLLRLNLSAERLSRAESRARTARQAERCPLKVSKNNRQFPPPQPRPTEAAPQPELPATGHPVRGSNDTIMPVPQVQPAASFMETNTDEPAASTETANPACPFIDAARLQRASQSVEIRRYGSMRSWAIGTVSRDALNAEPVPPTARPMRTTSPAVPASPPYAPGSVAAPA